MNTKGKFIMLGCSLSFKSIFFRYSGSESPDAGVLPVCLATALNGTGFNI